jgi:hypothetical protein
MCVLGSTIFNTVYNGCKTVKTVNKLCLLIHLTYG